MEFLSIINKNILEYPDCAAVVCKSKILTYSQLGKNITVCKQKLLCGGVNVGDKVILFSERCESYIIYLLALWEMGCIVIPLGMNIPDGRLQAVIEECEPQARIAIQNDNVTVKYYVDNARDESLLDCAYILFTSGSSGKPKGAVISRHALDVFVRDSIEATQYSALKYKSVLATASFSFDMHLIEVLFALVNHQSLVLASDNEVSNPRKIAKLVRENNVDVIVATPSKMTWLIQANKRQVDFLHNVKCFFFGGESLPEELVKMVSSTSGAYVFNVYGPTETTVFVTVGLIHEGQSVNLGKPLRNVRILIMDEYMRELNVGEKGEICLQGDQIGQGYYNNDEASRSNFVEFGKKRMYKTGDYGWIDPFSGKLMFAGRKDRQIKLHGNRIELDEIEKRLKQHEHIRDAIVMHDRERDLIVAYYQSDHNVSKSDIVKFLSMTLPEYMVPSILVEKDNFIMTESGKTDRNKGEN